QSAQQLKPLVGLQTRVITLQNGVDAEEKLLPILGADHVVPGLTQLATVIGSPGVISHTSPFALLRFGFSDRRSDRTLNEFIEACQKAGIDAALSDNVPRDIWTKFTLLAAMAGLTASTRKPIGQLLADPDTRALFHDIMKEIVAIARAKGVPLPADFA